MLHRQRLLLSLKARHNERHSRRVGDREQRVDAITPESDLDHKSCYTSEFQHVQRRTGGYVRHGVIALQKLLTYNL